MNVKIVLSLLVAAGLLNACSADPSAKKDGNLARKNSQQIMQEKAISKLTTGLKDGEIKLESYIDNNYLKSAYSFMFENQGNVDLTLNNWNLLFSGAMKDKNQFDVRVFENIGEFVSIVDLGERSCEDLVLKEIPASFKKDATPVSAYRTISPKEWFKNSEVMDALDKGQSEFIDAIKGHCYAYYSIERQGKIGAVFYVKESIPDQYVIIDSIEIFEREYKYNYLKY